MPRPASPTAPLLILTVVPLVACVAVDLCPGESPLPAKQLTNELQELLPSRTNALVTAVAGGARTSALPIPLSVTTAQPLTMPQRCGTASRPPLRSTRKPGPGTVTRRLTRRTSQIGVDEGALVPSSRALATILYWR